jgi:cellobiose transport system permease protein
MYEQGWFNFHLGRASAIAWTMFLILLLIAAVNAAVARRLRKSQ